MIRRIVRLRLLFTPLGVCVLLFLAFFCLVALVAGGLALSAASTPPCSTTQFASLPITPTSGGVVIAGKVSTFGPPGEASGPTASGNTGGDAVPGISLHIPGTHFADPQNVRLMNHLFKVTIGNHQAILPDIDLGPADYLNRAIDVTGAGARAMGIDPANFPTDSVGTAQLVGRANGLTGGGSLPVSAPVCSPPSAPGGGTVTPGSQAHINPDGTATIPADAPSQVQAAIRAANEIHTKPYPVPDQHYGDMSQMWPAYDCSGSASFVLYKAGLHSSTADVSGTMAGQGLPGRGKWISWYANSGHVWLVIAGLAFDTAHYGGPAIPSGSGPRWFPNPTANLADGLSYAVRHPPGL